MGGVTVPSETQKKVLRYLARQPNGSGQIAGYGRAAELSASRALARRGLLGNSRTGHYFLTDEGRIIAAELLAKWSADRDAAPSREGEG